MSRGFLYIPPIFFRRFDPYTTNTLGEKKKLFFPPRASLEMSTHRIILFISIVCILFLICHSGIPLMASTMA